LGLICCLGILVELLTLVAAKMNCDSVKTRQAVLKGFPGQDELSRLKPGEVPVENLEEVTCGD